jgi:hypothetical protein
MMIITIRVLQLLLMGAGGAAAAVTAGPAAGVVAMTKRVRSVQMMRKEKLQQVLRVRIITGVPAGQAAGNETADAEPVLCR